MSVIATKYVHNVKKSTDVIEDKDTDTDTETLATVARMCQIIFYYLLHIYDAVN